MSNITRKPLFWIAYAALSAIALVFAVRLFPLAIPLVNLDIRMSRAEALAKAGALAEKFNLAPPEARTAARFDHDGKTQNYVELEGGRDVEGGGRAAFAALTRGDVYSPYWWDVRLFALGTIDEAVIRFKPDGSPYGFMRRVAETYVRDPATKALDADKARALAEERARVDWGVDFAKYTLHDQSQQTLKSGRVDHAFVYERPEKLGDARVRLRLSVAGDELTGVAPFVFVPESFDRRFAELRSTNNLIAGLASASAGLLYGIGGCILGSLWLLRRHWLVWRPAFIAGLLVAGLLALAQLAGAPAAWFIAETTESPATFWLKQGGAFIFVLTAGGLGFTLAFMAGESLSRRAFPHHPQLWRLWSREAGATKQVLGRTAGGYLFVPLELALIAIFYYATNQWLGWWQPSENMSDPNILSSALPALSPIAISLQAGFMEECVFRAIPLALGALIGQHYGRRGLGIAIAFVLQALVFGGAHANYPGLPAYSRLVELIVPSMIWALLFLRFGLLPTILLHATFDLALFAIPVFLVDAPGARVQQALIVAAALVPVAVVLWRRLQAGAWTELPDALRNGAWQPPVVAVAEAVAAAPATPATEDRLAAAFQRALPLFALAGLALWALYSPFRPDVPSLSLGRDAAVAIADQALAARGVTLGPEWRRLSAVRLASDDGQPWAWHKFVWREAGPDTYRKQIGSALPPPVWEVRYATFDGDVAERAEEWRVTIAPDGQVRTLRHVIPQARAGARLAREAAEAIALQTLRKHFGLDPAALKAVAADEDKLPARTDWTFIFADPRVDLGNDSELRYVVTIAGDEMTGTGRVLHVPEAWLRAERERENRQRIARMGAGILIGISGLVALVLGILAWSKGRCDTQAVKWTAVITFVVALVGLANAWPLQVMQLNTAEPVTSQYLQWVLGALVGGLMSALLFGVLAGIGAWYARSAPRAALAGRLPPWAAAVAAGLFVAGVQAVIANLGPRSAPLWPNLQGASLWSPFGGAILSGLGFISSAGMGLFVVYIVARLTDDWRRRRLLGMGIVVVLQCAAALLQAGANVAVAAASGVAGGLAVAAVLWLLLRYDARIVPVYVATGVVLSMIVRAVQEGTPGGYAATGAAAVVTAAMTWAVTRYLATPLPPAAASESVTTASASSPNTA